MPPVIGELPRALLRVEEDMRRLDENLNLKIEKREEGEQLKDEQKRDTVKKNTLAGRGFGGGACGEGGTSRI